MKYISLTSKIILVYKLIIAMIVNFFFTINYINKFFFIYINYIINYGEKI